MVTDKKKNAIKRLMQIYRQKLKIYYNVNEYWHLLVHIYHNGKKKRNTIQSFFIWEKSRDTITSSHKGYTGVTVQTI